MGTVTTIKRGNMLSKFENESNATKYSRKKCGVAGHNGVRHNGVRYLFLDIMVSHNGVRYLFLGRAFILVSRRMQIFITVPDTIIPSLYVFEGGSRLSIDCKLGTKLISAYELLHFFLYCIFRNFFLVHRSLCHLIWR